MARIVVCGYMVRHPAAGVMLAYFHYVLGLHRLGHQVVYLEESGWPNSCYDPATHAYSDDPGPGLRMVRALMDAHGVSIPICFVNRDSGQVYGAEWREIKEMLAGADLLLNLGGVCWLSEFRLCARRAFVDMDPMFTQVGQFGAWLLHEHDAHFTYGVNIGQAGCTIPRGDVDWLPTVPPVVLDLWQGAEPTADATFTTVAHWSAYGGVTFQGEHYGQKDEEFLRLLELPSRTSQKLELALSGASQDVAEQFRTAGWSVREAAEVSTRMETYQSYILRSRGEFSAAKNAYVKTRSGWFSDRTVCYLAAGLPVVVQNTGFSDWLGTDRGVLAFSSLDGAAECLERVAGDYACHREAASQIAEHTFAHKVVLPRLLDLALGSIVAGRSSIKLDNH